MLIHGLHLFFILLFLFACVRYLPCGVGTSLFPPSMTSVSCWDGLLMVAFSASFRILWHAQAWLHGSWLFFFFFSDVLSFVLHSYGLGDLDFGTQRA